MAKISRPASDDGMVMLIRSKCLPIPLYGTEACNPDEVVKSLDYVITCSSLEIFSSNNPTAITNCKLTILVSTECLALLLHAEWDISAASLNPPIC